MRAIKTDNKKGAPCASLAATPAPTPSYPFRCNPKKGLMELFLQKKNRAMEKFFVGRQGDVSGKKNRGESALAPAFPENSY
jgi:hypothetical protein